MRISSVDIDQLINHYMQNVTGPCVTLYVTPKVQDYLKILGIKSTLYTLSIMRFKTEQEAVQHYNELVKYKAILWINGVRS